MTQESPRRTALARFVSFVPGRRDYNIGSLRVDLLAGVTVAFVALPLALGFGVTSGAGAAAGIVTAIVAGVIAAIFGGSDFQVTGPTGAMTAVLLPIVSEHGPGALPILGVTAGLILVGLAFLGVGRYVHYIPWPVVTGFTMGIAVIIFLQQLPSLLGVTAQLGESIVLISLAAVREWWAAPGFTALILGLLTVAVMLAWGRVRQLAVVPASMAALIITTLVSLLPVFGGVARIGAIPRSLPLPVLPSFAAGPGLVELARAAMAIAILAALESLLSAVVADGMTVGKKHDPDRELFGQGLGNIASGLFGGLPSTAALARTAVNVRSGARTRLSAIVHGVMLLLVILFLAPLAARIPLAVLGGILMVVAVRMIDREAFYLIVRSTKSDTFVLLLTMFVTILFDLILAIEVGLVAAAILFIIRMSSMFTVNPEDLTEELRAAAVNGADEERLDDQVVAYRVDGPIFFGAAERFIDQLLKVDPRIRVMILRLGRVGVMDATGVTALRAIDDRLKRLGITLMVSALQPQPEELLKRMGVHDEMLSHGVRFFATTEEAILSASELIGAQGEAAR